MQKNLLILLFICHNLLASQPTKETTPTQFVLNHLLKSKTNSWFGRSEWQSEILKPSFKITTKGKDVAFEICHNSSENELIVINFEIACRLCAGYSFFNNTPISSLETNNETTYYYKFKTRCIGTEMCLCGKSIFPITEFRRLIKYPVE